MQKYSGAVNIKPSSIYFKTAQAHQFSQKRLLGFKLKEKKHLELCEFERLTKKKLIKKLVRQVKLVLRKSLERLLTDGLIFYCNIKFFELELAN